jgi:hypothetical protein
VPVSGQTDQRSEEYTEGKFHPKLHEDTGEGDVFYIYIYIILPILNFGARRW